MEKKRNIFAIRIFTLILAVFTIFFPFTVLATENVEKGEKEYGAYEKENYEGTILLEDISTSMTSTFAEEVEKMEVEREKFSNYTTFGASGKTNLYEQLNNAFSKFDSVSIITDLWDTSEIGLKDWKGKDLRIYLPFKSNDEKACKHVEDIVYSDIATHLKDSFVKVIYLDESEGEVLLESETAKLKDAEQEELIKAQESSKTTIVEQEEEISRQEEQTEIESVIIPRHSYRIIKEEKSISFGEFILKLLEIFFRTIVQIIIGFVIIAILIVLLFLAFTICVAVLSVIIEVIFTIIKLIFRFLKKHKIIIELLSIMLYLVILAGLFFLCCYYGNIIVNIFMIMGGIIVAFFLISTIYKIIEVAVKGISNLFKGNNDKVEEEQASENPIVVERIKSSQVIIIDSDIGKEKLMEYFVVFKEIEDIDEKIIITYNYNIIQCFYNMENVSAILGNLMPKKEEVTEEMIISSLKLAEEMEAKNILILSKKSKFTKDFLDEIEKINKNISYLNEYYAI